MSAFSSTRYHRALDFAKKAHGAQVRKYTGEPYWTHLKAVAGAVLSADNCTMEMVEAALLHDVVEDTPVTIGEVLHDFGYQVAFYVDYLTDPPVGTGNRATRKAMVVARMRAAPKQVKTIKLADLIDNTSSIVAHDPKFAPVFLAEKRMLLPALEGGDAKLLARAKEVLTLST